MYSVLTYPLQVISTNRILQTSFAKEGAESLPRELSTLYEKGHFQRGVLRGYLLYFVLQNFQNGSTVEPDIVGGALLTALGNPLNVMLVQRQAVQQGQNFKNYGEIVKEQIKINPVRLFGLGFIATFLRNVTMCTGFIPQIFGFSYMPINFLYCAGAMVISHPFEVARVMIQHDPKSGMFGQTWRTISNLYSYEGLTGVFRGFIPRSIHCLPMMLTVSALMDPQTQFSFGQNAQPE